MKTNNIKSKQSKKNVATQGPGRPAYVPIIPNKRFTFDDLCTVNEVNLETGKGPKCSALTLRKWIAANLPTNPKDSSSVIVKAMVKGNLLLANPSNEKGLGRKAYVYVKRSLVAAAPKSRKSGAVTVPAATVTPAATPETAPTPEIPAEVPAVA